MRTVMLLVVMAVAAITAPLTAQDYAADITKAMEVFSSDQLQLNVDVNVYSTYASQEPMQNYKAVLKKDGNKYYSEMENTRMLLNDKYLVMVYDNDRRVICTERDKKSDRKMKNGADPSGQIDSLLKKNDSIVYQGIVNSAKVYSVYTGKSIIRRTEIHLDTKTGSIKSLVYYYNEKFVPTGNKVRIDYIINASPTFSSSEFSEKRFVVFGRGDAITAGAECTGYNVTFVDPNNSTVTEK